MSVVRDLILKADDDLRYPSSGELRSMVDFLSQGSIRLSVVRSLTENEKKIIDDGRFERTDWKDKLSNVGPIHCRS